MNKGKKKGRGAGLPVVMLLSVLCLTGCVTTELDNAEGAIRQEQKYQEYISDTKQNDREVEDTLDEIMEESEGDVGVSTVSDPTLVSKKEQKAETLTEAKEEPVSEAAVKSELQFRKKNIWMSIMKNMG